MEHMFDGSQFNGCLANWDVSKVGYFACMFQNSPFSGDVSRWNTKSALEMNAMFAQTPNFNSPLSGWDVSQVISIEEMFKESAFAQDISHWKLPSNASTIDLHKNNPRFIQAQKTMTPFILGVLTQTDELPSDPGWAKAMEQVRPVARGLGLARHDHVQAVMDTHARIAHASNDPVLALPGGLVQ